MPEFIVPQDGAETQDCERNAAKRWLSTHGGRLRGLWPLHLGHDLFACQPVAEAIRAADGDFLRGAAVEGRTAKQKAGSKRLTCRYRWFKDTPLRDRHDAMRVNWVSVTRDTVGETAACARARWKIENEGFNVLKSNGHHLEHNFGHGKQNLAMVFAAMNLLASAIHTVCDCLEQAWIDARAAKRARKRRFEHLRTLTASLLFPNRQTLMQPLINAKPPPDIAAQIAL